MLKYWRILLLLVCLISAILAIGLKAYPYGRNGVKIVYISDDSPAKGVLEQGMYITKVNGAEIKNIDDWTEKTKDAKELTLTANGKDYQLSINRTLGINVVDIERTNLDFGLDLEGGTRVLLKPKENATKEMIEQIISTLQTRANVYGLKEIHFYPVTAVNERYVQIEAAGVGSEVIDNLLSKQGKFEAKLIKPVKIENNAGNLQIGKRIYPVTAVNESVELNGSLIRPNQTFALEGISFQFVNRTGNKLIFLAKVYDGKDIELVYTDPERSAVYPRGKVYFFYFTVLISEEGAKRFADLTSGIDSYFDIQSGEEYLDSKMMLYLDDELVSELNIGASLGGQIIQTPSIQGSRTTREEALDERLRLQTILRSGALPTGLEVVSRDIISPTLGKDFFSSAFYAAAVAALMVVAIVFIRYRNLKIALPMLFVGLSEVIIILGIAATNDVLIWGVALILTESIILAAFLKGQEFDISGMIGATLIPLLGMLSWTIDLAAIAGIVAAIGTGIDHQIIIADETLRKEKKEKIYTVKDRIKKAFFIIFGAAATTIAAMSPLMFLGIGLVKGFAITTTVGVLSGLLITRPAYASIIENLLKK
jgi:preprotein translocase subunit SecD